MKNKLQAVCSTCSIIAAAIGIVCIGTYIWQVIDAHFMDTIQLLLKLF
ncbi:hypothetical protein [Lysinibacillus sp. 54212]